MSDEFAPVSISTGAATMPVGSTLHAIEFMDEWPRDRRGPAYLTTYRCLLRALYREVDDQTASRAFRLWAKSVAILVPEVEAHIAGDNLPKRPGGRILGS